MQQCYVQYDMHEKLKNDETAFEKFTLSRNDFEKGKINDDEIKINDRLYDIKSVNMIGDKVEFLAFNDTDEEAVLAKIKNIVNANSEQNTELPNQLIKLLSLIYLPANYCHHPVFAGLQQNFFHNYSETIISHTSEICSPPPELV
ncbi:MAG: hypothetical protein SGJ10_03465 [Bacteroidota bacterium]|nr:hypothetical protein [Bacteroidota bacterium]